MKEIIIYNEQNEAKIGICDIWKSDTRGFIVYGDGESKNFDNEIDAVREAYSQNGIKSLPDFWEYAKCTNSIKISSPGCIKYRMKYGDKLRKVRRYVDVRTGEKRVTVELEPEI